MILAVQIVALVKESMRAYRVYLETKLKRYELHLKKKRMNALKIAERMDECVDEILTFTSEKIALNDEGWQEFYKLRKKYNRLDRKFDKIN
jgi:hypothetical protein